MATGTFKMCGLSDPPLKIQNWKKHCLSCSHCQLVALRAINEKNVPIYYEKAYMLGCPHIIWLRDFCIPTKFEIARIGMIIDLIWYTLPKIQMTKNLKGLKK